MSSTYEQILAAIQAKADATGNAQIRIAIGEPGDHVKNALDEIKPTGSAWEPAPKVQALIIEGIAAWLDASGVGSALREKVNEIVGAYMQLKADYNAGTVPTTAADVDPLP